MLNLGFFLSTLTKYKPTGQEPVISTVVMDSREAEANSLFVAESGEGDTDGHDFVNHAFNQGAVAALISHPVSGNFHTIDLRNRAAADPLSIPGTPVCLLVDDSIQALQETASAWCAQFKATIIGITGSVGKTSTKELAHAVLSNRFQTFKSEGNRNSILGLPLTIFNLRPHHQYAVLEMAMYTRGEIARLTELFPPKIGVVTLIGAVHLERAGSMEAIVEAKRELVEALPADGIAILNKDDARVMSMQDHTTAKIFTYGLDPSADLWAANIQSMGLDGVRFTLNYQGDSINVHVPLLGRHSVHTSLRAAALGLVTGMNWGEIAQGLRSTAAQLRVVTVPGPKGSIILDDTYNANPESMMAALNLLADMRGRKLAVLGDMAELGHMEKASHEMIGRRAAVVADELVAIGPRGKWIGEEAAVSGLSPRLVHFAADAETAVSLIESLIQPNDFILIKGSYSMQMDQIVNALGRYD